MQNSWIPPEHWLRIRRNLSKADLYLCEILKATGLRVDDLMTSKSWNWKICPRWLIVIEQKTGKIRKIKKTGWLLSLARCYREEIAEPWASDWKGYFCPSQRKAGTHVNRSTIYRHFEKAVRKARLDHLGYTIHSLRKCYAVDLYTKLGSIEAVRKELNHDRITTTFIYLMEALDINP